MNVTLFGCEVESSMFSSIKYCPLKTKTVKEFLEITILLLFTIYDLGFKLQLVSYKY